MAILKERVELLTLRIREASHRADGRLEREVARATPDAARVEDRLRQYVEPVDRDGLQLVADLQQAGRVQMTPFSTDMTIVGVHLRVPKAAVLPDAGLSVVLLAPVNLAEQEDSQVLRPDTRDNCAEVKDWEELGDELDAALTRMAEGGFPPSHIILPWDFRLAQWLVERGGQFAIRGRHELGTYRGVRLFRGPLRWPGDLIMVLSLNRWIRIQVATPPAESAPLHPRFRAEFRPPSPEETQQLREQDPPRSVEGLAFEGEDLESALTNQWHLLVQEALRIETTAEDAMVCFRLRLNGRDKD
jgi:hypothetical protein